MRPQTVPELVRVIERARRSVCVDPQVPSCLDRLRYDDEPAADVIAAQRRDALRAAFAELPADRGELMTLLLADPPLAYRDISRILGIPVGSIGPTRARALEQLRRSDALQGWRASPASVRTR
jgi:DNA-directed RNA polymerase specialized sigma24 family protein